MNNLITRFEAVSRRKYAGPPLAFLFLAVYVVAGMAALTWFSWWTFLLAPAIVSLLLFFCVTERRFDL